MRRNSVQTTYTSESSSAASVENGFVEGEPRLSLKRSTTGCRSSFIGPTLAYLKHSTAFYYRAVENVELHDHSTETILVAFKSLTFFSRSAQAAGPGYVGLWVRGCARKVQETMQRHIQGLGKNVDNLWNRLNNSSNKCLNPWPNRPNMLPKQSEEWHEAEAASPRRLGRP